MPQRLAVACDDIDLGQINTGVQDGTGEFIPEAEIQIANVRQGRLRSWSSQPQDPSSQLRRDRDLAIGKKPDGNVRVGCRGDPTQGHVDSFSVTGQWVVKVHGRKEETHRRRWCHS